MRRYARRRIHSWFGGNTPEPEGVKLWLVGRSRSLLRRLVPPSLPSYPGDTPPHTSALKAGSSHPLPCSPVTNPERKDRTCPHPPRLNHGSTRDGLGSSLMLVHPARGCRSIVGKILPSYDNWKGTSRIIVCQRWKRGHGIRTIGSTKSSLVRNTL